MRGLQSRLKRIESAAGNTWADREAEKLLASITDSELQAIAGPDTERTPEMQGASPAALAALIFDTDPELLARCRQRLAADPSHG